MKELNIPIGDVLEQLIAAEILDGDIDELTTAPINGEAAHLLQIVRHVV